MKPTDTISENNTESPQDTDSTSSTGAPNGNKGHTHGPFGHGPGFPPGPFPPGYGFPPGPFPMGGGYCGGRGPGRGRCFFGGILRFLIGLAILGAIFRLIFGFHHVPGMYYGPEGGYMGPRMHHSMMQEAPMNTITTDSNSTKVSTGSNTVTGSVTR